MIRTTLAHAQQFILRKNYLAGAKAADLFQLFDALPGLPADPPVTPFLAARARLDNFAPEQLQTELNQTRRLIAAPLMQNRPHIAPAARFPSLHAATVRQRKQALNADLRLWGVERNEEIEGLGQAILETVEAWPAGVQDVAGQLPPEQVTELTQTSRGGRVSTTSNVELALRWLIFTGQLNAANESANWWEAKPRYAPLAQRYPTLDLDSAPGEAEAQRVLVRAYLAAFGPATEADISFWAGLSKSETARATGALSRETTLTLVQGIPGMLLMLKEQGDALQATESPVEPVVNALPANDPFTTAHRASRTRYFADPSLQRRVFSSSGASKPALVVNGQIVGLWDGSPEEQPQTITWQALASLDPAVESLIQAELQHVANFIQPGMAIEAVT